MYSKNDLDNDLINEFKTLGISDENDMISILNGLDGLAEIGYTIYKKGRNDD
ncbi:MAG: hypothetical protein U0K42_04550 [Bacteroidales bacterium]|nr:hypothetical protein [Bacteroidales bacterium]